MKRLRRHVWRKSGKDRLIVKNGYKRMLLSYLPLVLISVSAVVFISFIVVTDMMTREAEKADTVSAKRVVGTVEGAAREIESTVLNELAVNRPIHDFMNNASDENMRLTQYELSKDLNKLAESYSAIQSIYVYRARDGMVLTLHEILSLSDFPDKEFVAAHFSQERTQKWLNARWFTDSKMRTTEQVISFTQRFPLPLGSEGIVVVNVSVEKLIALTEDMRTDGLSVLQIRDSKTGNALYASTDLKDEENMNVLKEDIFTFEYPSSYLGWTFYSGIKEGSLFAWVSVISYIWVAIGILVLVGSLLAFIYIFKRNYRPVELLLQRIQQFPLQHLPKQKAKDEFAYIEKALENLIETNKEYELRQQEEWGLGKRQFIRDWLEGEVSFFQVWSDKARQYGIPIEMGACTVAVIELEQYQDFQQQHQERDQSVLKFSLANVVRERWARQGHVELEWVASNRLTILWLHETGEVPEEQQRWARQHEDVVNWIKQHLNIAVRIGFGEEVIHYSDVSVSYKGACEALRYKLISDKVIFYSQASRISSNSAYSYYRHMAECIKNLHTMNEGWREQVESIFEQIQVDQLTDDEIYAIIDYAAMLLLEEAEGVAVPDVRARLGEHVTTLQRQIGQEKYFSGLYTTFIEHLERFYTRYCAYKKSNKYQETINLVKRYIEENYTDPDLSLTQISDKFALKPKYASQLFKEEFGMKFVDFLLTLRMEEAKKRLIHTDDPIQDIALQIGYATSISFGRMFKKMEGVTPGDYRKMKLRPHEALLSKGAAK